MNFKSSPEVCSLPAEQTEVVRTRMMSPKDAVRKDLEGYASEDDVVDVNEELPLVLSVECAGR